MAAVTNNRRPQREQDQMKNDKLKNGFTLIEILVSVGLIALVGTLVAQVFFTTVRTSVKTELLKETKQSGDVALDTMSRLIRGSADILTVCDSAGTTTSTMQVQNADGYASTFGCGLDGAVARIASVSGTKTEYLTNSDVTLGPDCGTSSLSFVCTALAAGGTSVKITFSLAQVGTPPDQYSRASTTFQTTVTTRN